MKILKARHQGSSQSKLSSHGHSFRVSDKIIFKTVDLVHTLMQYCDDTCIVVFQLFPIDIMMFKVIEIAVNGKFGRYRS